MIIWDCTIIEPKNGKYFVSHKYFSTFQKAKVWKKDNENEDKTISVSSAEVE